MEIFVFCIGLSAFSQCNDFNRGQPGRVRHKIRPIMRYLKSDFRAWQEPVFRGVYGEIFALFQAFVCNFYTVLPWKVVGTLNLDSSYVTFKYFAFLSV